MCLGATMILTIASQVKMSPKKDVVYDKRENVCWFPCLIEWSKKTSITSATQPIPLLVPQHSLLHGSLGEQPERCLQYIHFLPSDEECMLTGSLIEAASSS